MLKANFRIEALEEESDYGKFVFEPLQQGFGHTVGNALRRTLLSSLRGAAVEKVRMEDVKHPFSTIEGVKEDVVQILLNIKEIKVKYQPAEAEEEQRAELEFEVSGPGDFTAGDIEVPSDVEIVNPDLVIANLANKDTQLKGEMWVGSGVGYSPAEERESDIIGELSVDATYSPIVRVNYKVQPTRVGRRTDLDKLVMEVWTDGTVDPREGIEEAAEILVGFFKQVYNPVFEEKEDEREKRPENYETLALTVEELNLPTRIVNALRRGGYKTVKDLVGATEIEVKKVKNIGKKSIKVIKERLAEKGVSFQDDEE